MFGFDFMNSVFPVIFTVMFVGIFIMFIVTAVRGIGRWHKNNNSPRLTVARPRLQAHGRHPPP